MSFPQINRNVKHKVGCGSQIFLKPVKRISIHVLELYNNLNSRGGGGRNHGKGPFTPELTLYENGVGYERQCRAHEKLRTGIFQPLTNVKMILFLFSEINVKWLFTAWK